MVSKSRVGWLDLRPYLAVPPTTTSPETKLYPHAPYGDKKLRGGVVCQANNTKGGIFNCGQCKDTQKVMDMGLSVGICVYSVAKLD